VTCFLIIFVLYNIHISFETFSLQEKDMKFLEESLQLGLVHVKIERERLCLHGRRGTSLVDVPWMTADSSSTKPERWPAASAWTRGLGP
jgi:hypothetical protein